MADTPHPQRVFLPVPGHSSDLVHADADYFRAKARQHFRLARQSSDAETARALHNLGVAFETQASVVADENPDQ